MRPRPAARRSILLAAALSIAAAAQAIEPYDELPDDRVLYIAPGQSLAALVREIYPAQRGQWAEIRRWIVDHNPHAFVDGDPARLRADVRVRLPGPKALGEAEEAGAAGRGVAAGDAAFELRFDDRYLFVDPAQSLETLVPRVYPGAAGARDRIIAAIMAENPGVFADGRAASTLPRGQRIRIPELVRSTGAGGGADEPPPRVGTVRAVRGRLTATGPDGDTRRLSTGDPVRRHDELRTGASARAEIRLRDGERLFLRPRTTVHVRAWELPDVGPGQRVIELARGGLRAVTGAIGNRSGDDYRTVTPQATLGIRGTAYALRVCGAGECRLGGDDSAAAVPPGLYLAVRDGAVSLLNETGETRHAAGSYTFVAGPASEPAAADPDVRRILYSAAERERLEWSGGEAGEAGEEKGAGLWWALGGLLLLGLAL